MKDTVTITVSGPTGSGKSAICGEIEIALKAVGVDVVWDDDAERQMNAYAETNGRETLLEQYEPRVVIVERNIPRAPASGTHTQDAETAK